LKNQRGTGKSWWGGQTHYREDEKFKECIAIRLELPRDSQIRREKELISKKQEVGNKKNSWTGINVTYSDYPDSLSDPRMACRRT